MKDCSRDIQNKRDEIRSIKSSESEDHSDKMREVDTKMKKKSREITNQEKLIKSIKGTYLAIIFLFSSFQGLQIEPKRLKL